MGAQTVTLHPCPTCDVGLDEPCRTPSGRKRKAVHEGRPFGLTLPDDIRDALAANSETGFPPSMREALGSMAGIVASLKRETN